MGRTWLKGPLRKPRCAFKMSYNIIGLLDQHSLLWLEEFPVSKAWQVSFPVFEHENLLTRDVRLYICKACTLPSWKSGWQSCGLLLVSCPLYSPKQNHCFQKEPGILKEEFQIQIQSMHFLSQEGSNRVQENSLRLEVETCFGWMGWDGNTIHPPTHSNSHWEGKEPWEITWRRWKTQLSEHCFLAHVQIVTSVEQKE